MNGDDLLESIRVRAYYLWEKAGRPEGGDIAFWEEARQQVELRARDEGLAGQRGVSGRGSADG